MDATEIARIRGNAAFRELERQRSTLSWSLAILMMVLYGTFLVLVAFDKPLVATPIGQGPMTLAFPLGIGMILVAIVVTGLYVWRANTLFDRLTAEIVAGAGAVPGVGAVR